MRSGTRLAIGATGIVLLALSAGGFTAKAASSGLSYTVPTGPVTANANVNNLDCNGWAPGTQTVKLNMRELCTDPAAPADFINPYTGYTYGHTSPFYDNGHYVGHDEPTVKFISNTAGSGYQMTFYQQLAVDPGCAPTTNPATAESASCSDYAELSPAPWFGLPICDPMSFPAAVTVTGGGVAQAPCSAPGNSGFTSNSESNSGQAFMEMQFYPPGYGPWIDSASPDLQKWTAALNIDSLEAISATTPFTSGFETNPKCTEPVNFAFITQDGKPVGPPSPQQADLETFSTYSTSSSSLVRNPDVLYMNPGDTLKVVIDDVASPSEPSTSPDSATDAGGLRITITDVSTGQTGFMVASAANGFMDTSPLNCQGSNWSFHALYNTAAQGNQVQWAALEGGVLMEDEIGHSEVCTGTSSSGLANQDAATATYTGSTDTFADSSVYDVCNDSTSDPLAGQTSTNSGGEGTGCAAAACPPNSGTTEDTQPSNTYGGRACTASDSHCESADGFCLPQGARTVLVNGNSQTWTDPVAYCDTARYQNGDLDYDGTDYQTLWPDGSSTTNVYAPKNHPTTFRYIGPFDASGNPYGLTQIETDSAGSENDCNTTTGANCTVPAFGAPFYPFWSLSSLPIPGLTVSGQSAYCVWNFGNDGNPQELDDFGGDGTVPANGSFNSQYATPGSHYKGTLITGPVSNPQINGSSSAVIGGKSAPSYSCPSFTLTQVVTSNGTVTPEAPWLPALALTGAGALAVIGVRRRRHTTA